MGRRIPTATWRWLSVLAPAVVHVMCVLGWLPTEVATTAVCHASEDIADDFTEEDKPAPPPPVAIISPERYLKEINDRFDEIVFDQRGPQVVNDARKRLETIAADRIISVDRICSLRPEQFEKLERAALRDIRQLFERLDARKFNFHDDWITNLRKGRRGADVADCDQLRYPLRHGPFGDESFFAKVLRTVLTEEQVRKCDQHQLRAARSKREITTENVDLLTLVDRRQAKADCFQWDRQGNRLGMLQNRKCLEIYTSDGALHLASVGSDRNPVGFDFSPDENLIAIVTDLGTAFVIDQTTGRETELRSIATYTGIRFSADGTHLLTSSDEGAVAIWSVLDGKRLKDFDVGDIRWGMAPAFSPDGLFLAASNRRSMMSIFDSETGRLRQVIEWKPACEFRFDSTGRRLAMGYRGGNLLVCDPRTGAKLAVAKAGLDDPLSLDWSSDGKMLVSAGSNGAITFWDANGLDRIKDIVAPEHVVAVRFIQSGTRLVFAGGTFSKSIHYVETWAVPEGSEGVTVPEDSPKR